MLRLPLRSKAQRSLRPMQRCSYADGRRGRHQRKHLERPRRGSACWPSRLAWLRKMRQATWSRWELATGFWCIVNAMSVHPSWVCARTGVLDRIEAFWSGMAWRILAALAQGAWLDASREVTLSCVQRCLGHCDSQWPEDRRRAHHGQCASGTALCAVACEGRLRENAWTCASRFFEQRFVAATRGQDVCQCVASTNSMSSCLSHARRLPCQLNTAVGDTTCHTAAAPPTPK